MAGELDIIILQGETWHLNLTWKTGSDPVPVDLTGYQARAQARPDFTSETVLFSLDDTDGIVLGGVDGTIRLTLTDEQTAALNFETGVWDLEMENPSGDVRRLLEGTVSLDPEVTR